jgi:hypothetical protein
MRNIFSWIIIGVLTIGLADCQELPDAPVPQVQPAAKCGPFSCWTFINVPTKEVLRSKALWLTFGADVALTTLDAEVTHEGLAHHLCVEKNIDPPYPSRWQLYRAQLPENAAVFAVSFLWLKLHGPKYIMPGFLAFPAVAHIRGAAGWLDNCW